MLQLGPSSPPIPEHGPLGLDEEGGRNAKEEDPRILPDASEADLQKAAELMLRRVDCRARAQLHGPLTVGWDEPLTPSLSQFPHCYIGTVILPTS